MVQAHYDGVVVGSLVGSWAGGMVDLVELGYSIVEDLVGRGHFGVDNHHSLVGVDRIGM